MSDDCSEIRVTHENRRRDKVPSAIILLRRGLAIDTLGHVKL